jgi:hypothetical protein
MAKAGRARRKRLVALAIERHRPGGEDALLGRRLAAKRPALGLREALRMAIRTQARLRRAGHWAFEPDRLRALLAALIVSRRALCAIAPDRPRPPPEWLSLVRPPC